jgi:hypothetical protein
MDFIILITAKCVTQAATTTMNTITSELRSNDPNATVEFVVVPMPAKH